MRRIRRALLVMLLPGAVIAATVSGTVGASVAQAYGTDHVYQLTYSLNCDNKASPLCAPNAFGLGGAWGWIEPDSDGTVDGQATFCGHNQGPSGAVHQSLDGISWSIVPASQLSPAQFVVGTDPTGNYIVFDPNSAIGFIAFPVTPNHYSTSFGPGITAQATVSLMH
jgi:hypothetical protein